MHLIQQTRDVSHRIYLCGIKTRPVKVLAAMNSPDYQLPLPGLTLQIQDWLVLNEICSSINSTILQYPVHSRSVKTFVKNVLVLVPLAQVYRYRTGSFKQITSKSPHITNPITHLSMFD